MEIFSAWNASASREDLEDVAQDVALRRITCSCHKPSEARRKQGFGERSAERRALMGKGLFATLWDAVLESRARWAIMKMKILRRDRWRAETPGK
jgi:hypothetical protein